MAFMTPEYDCADFVRMVDDRGESILVPDEYGADAEKDGYPVEAAWRGKWFYRLSASGYLDCTAWTGPFNTLAEAREALSAEYDCDPDTGDAINE